MRSGAEFFLQPSGAAQRRYEALRAYFVHEMPAAQVADQFGYSTASVHQMATLLRTGKLDLFTETKPGPKGPHKATGEVRDKVLALRAEDRSIGEIAASLAAAGTPISAQVHSTLRTLIEDTRPSTRSMVGSGGASVQLPATDPASPVRRRTAPSGGSERKRARGLHH